MNAAQVDQIDQSKPAKPEWTIYVRTAAITIMAVSWGFPALVLPIGLYLAVTGQTEWSELRHAPHATAVFLAVGALCWLAHRQVRKIERRWDESIQQYNTAQEAIPQAPNYRKPPAEPAPQRPNPARWIGMIGSIAFWSILAYLLATYFIIQPESNPGWHSWIYLVLTAAFGAMLVGHFAETNDKKKEKQRQAITHYDDLV